MTIWTDMPVRRGPFYLEDYQSSLDASLGASAEGAFVTDPVPSILRSGELTAAEQGPLNLPTQLGLSALGAINPVAKAYQAAQGPGLPSFFRSPPNSPVVDATSARQRIKDEGLDLTVSDTGIRSRALDILIDRKKAERKRNDILSRAPGGFVAGAARLGTNLAVSALDPLNIASAFIPVVGEARYSAMLARASGAFGRAGVRAGVGAVEGAVGAAVVEPVVSLAAHQEQADYDLTDSIANIAFGTVLGGGLHVGAGVISDAVRAGRDWRTARASPDAPIPRMMESVDAGTREAALRTGVAQAVSGREINIEPVVSYAKRQGFEEPLRASVGPAEAPRIDEVTGVEGFTVFHGSPHDFEKFSMEHIGAGEGAQAYGHGLYFAQSRGVAQSYRNALSPRDVTVEFRGRDKAAVTFDAANTHEQVALGEIAEGDGTLENALQNINRKIADYADPTAPTRRLLERAGDIIKEWASNGATIRMENAGALYEVRIRANPEDFLDWDKPLSEQSQKVQEALQGFDSNMKGSDAYNAAIGIATESGNNITHGGGSKQAGDWLREHGISGIKYLDAGSRTAGDGSRNFVVFDDSLLHTVRRNDEFIAKQPQDLRATAQASFNPEQMRLYDGEAVRMADERIAAAPDDETMPEVTLKEAMEDVTRLAAQLGDPEIVGREMAEVNELAKTADEYGRAVFAAADCRLRRA